MISDQRTGQGIPHAVSCRALGVYEAWYYKWRNRSANPTNHEVRRAALSERIKHFFDASGGTYGSPRVTPDLWAEGWKVSVNTVAGIMAEFGLYGREPKKRGSLTRQSKRAGRTRPGAASLRRRRPGSAVGTKQTRVKASCACMFCGIRSHADLYG